MITLSFFVLELILVILLQKEDTCLVFNGDIHPLTMSDNYQTNFERLNNIINSTNLTATPIYNNTAKCIDLHSKS